MGGLFSKKSKKAKAKKNASKGFDTEVDIPFIDEGTSVDGPEDTPTVSMHSFQVLYFSKNSHMEFVTRNKRYIRKCICIYWEIWH